MNATITTTMATAGRSTENICQLIWSSAKLAALHKYRDNVFKSTNGFCPRTFNRGDIGLMEREKKYGVSALMLYEPGFEFLEKRTSGGGLGDYDHELEVLYERLEEFIRDRDLHTSCMENVFNGEEVSETAITLAMAVHLFGKLVPEGALTVNKYMKGLTEFKNKCPCGCGASFRTGDTGIGLSYAWHGFPDMLVPGVPIINPKPVDDDEENESSHSALDEQCEETDRLDKPPEKMCFRDSDDQSELPNDLPAVTVDLKHDYIIGQMVATTITNSYAQVSAQPELGSKFVPSICCSKSGTIIYAYNVDEDLFLNNSEEEVFFERKYTKQELNLVMVIEVWLTLNIHLTGTKSSNIKPWITKSRFQELGDASIYEEAQLKASKFEKPSDCSEFFTIKRTEVMFWPGDESPGHALERFITSLNTN